VYNGISNVPLFGRGYFGRLLGGPFIKIRSQCYRHLQRRAGGFCEHARTVLGLPLAEELSQRLRVLSGHDKNRLSLPSLPPVYSISRILRKLCLHALREGCETVMRIARESPSLIRKSCGETMSPSPKPGFDLALSRELRGLSEPTALSASPETSRF